jgi:hypothetical protein
VIRHQLMPIPAPDTTPRRPHWTDRALCRQDGAPDPETWFPARKDDADARTALGWCAACPVADACRADAIARREKYGIWGGLTQDDLREATHGEQLERQRTRQRERYAQKRDRGAGKGGRPRKAPP